MSSSLIKNRRYRQKHRRRDKKNAKRWKEPLVIPGKDSQCLEFSYVKTSLEILQSLIHSRWTFSGWTITKLLHEADEEVAKRSMMSAVFWPTLWDGIWKQFCIDVPRMRVHFQDEIWRDPEALFTALEQTMGPLWTRWLCVFLNQSPMADVFSCVWKHVQHTFGHHFLISDGGFHTHMYIIFPSAADQLKLEILKTFSIRSRSSLQAPGDQVVKTRYEVTFYPEMKIQLQWEYNSK